MFKDRSLAGKKLVKYLQHLNGIQDVVVLGLTYGGCIVAHEVAKALHLPHEVLVVQKIGAPDNAELALGAINDRGDRVFNEHLISLLGVSKEYLLKEVERHKDLVQEKKRLYSKGKEPTGLSGKTVILIDDGIATGASMKVGIESVRARHAMKIILAVPVASSESIDELKPLVDDIICLSRPQFFQAVSMFYEDFFQVTDQHIIALSDTL